MNTDALKSTHAPTTTPVTWHFDHVNVSMGASHALNRLFEGVMGMQPGYRPPFPFPGLWLYAQEEAFVHAVDDPSLSASTGAVRFGHIAFRSDQSAEVLIEKLRSSGLPFRVARVPEENTAQVFVLLPGGFVVELDVPDDPNLNLDHQYRADQASPGNHDF
ncbi:hypothetical protein [Pseudomonas sp. KU43P]|uniref:hypothetical protein n=1 Tax=Pseudomonas sp. KU43P TaxID=2487887 RepID=UPI0012A85C19|nr:hypothetical protein [Pseudomonas sp. KU43P]BBH46086.1 hypothetical protein KU43P_25630 [Pseudomonas sp. KU43P]